MGKTKYSVTLTDQERKALKKKVKTGNGTARSILRANVLLASDTNAKSKMTVAEIASAFNTTENTVVKVRKDYLEKGMEGALVRKKRETPPVPGKVDGDLEAHILQIACSNAPEGYAKWSVRLIANRCVELGYIESISHTAVATVLKKAKSNLT